MNRYAHWQLLRRMRQDVDASTLTSCLVNAARAHILPAPQLLTWSHQPGTSITELTQTQLEEYLSDRPGTPSAP